MVLVYPDTNAMWGDPFLSGVVGGKILNALETAGGVLCISPVVVAELRKRMSREVGQMVADVEGSAKQISKLVGEAPTGLLTETRQLATRLRDRIDAEFARLLAHPVVRVEDFPAVASRDMVDRSVEGRLPFHRDSAGVTSGHNDALIWEGLKTLLGSTDLPVVFVTKDRAFRDKRGRLQIELQNDLTDAGIDARRLELADSLHRVLTHSLSAATSASELAILDYLWGIAQDFPNFAFGWVRGQSEGELHEGDYVLDLDPRLEDVELLRLSNGGNGTVHDRNPSVGSLEIELQFRARVRHSNRQALEDPRVSVWLLEPNSGSVVVGFTRRVLLTGRFQPGHHINEPELIDGEVQVAIVA